MREVSVSTDGNSQFENLWNGASSAIEEGAVMLELLAELLTVVLEMIINVASKEGRYFFRDMRAIMTGGRLENHRWEKPVC
jgi:hypothetical protein